MARSIPWPHAPLCGRFEQPLLKWRFKKIALILTATGFDLFSLHQAASAIRPTQDLLRCLSWLGLGLEEVAASVEIFLLGLGLEESAASV